MRVELHDPRAQPADILDQKPHFVLDLMRLLADAGVAHDRLHDLDRHHQKRRRDDDDLGFMRLLDEILEMLVQIGIKRFRRHEEHGYVLGLAGDEISLGNILDMFADIAAHAGLRLFQSLFV